MEKDTGSSRVSTWVFAPCVVLAFVVAVFYFGISANGLPAHCNLYNPIQNHSGDVLNSRSYAAHKIYLTQAPASKKPAEEKPSQSEGNFKEFERAVSRFGYTFVSTLNGYSIYKKDGDFVTMRNCNGFCCEAIVSVKAIEREEAASNVMCIYPLLENSLVLNDKEAVDGSDPSILVTHVYALVDQVLTNLKQANRTEFAFDHLNVRGELPPVSAAELKDGKKPRLQIKLWIP